MADPAMRDMTTGEMLVEAFRLYRDHFATLVGIALVAHLVLLAFSYAVEAAMLPPVPSLTVIFMVTLGVQAVTLAAMTYAVAGAVLGREPGVIEAYRHGFLGSRLFGIVAAYVFVWAVITLGMAAFIIPALLLGGLFLPLVPLMVLEREGPARAVVRSVEIMRPVWFKGVAIFAWVVLISGLLPILAVLALGTGPFSPLLSAIVGAVTLPLAYAANVVCYLSVRGTQGFTRAELQAAVDA